MSMFHFLAFTLDSETATPRNEKLLPEINSHLLSLRAQLARYILVNYFIGQNVTYISSFRFISYCKRRIY
jgi:hypothetical protein